MMDGSVRALCLKVKHTRYCTAESVPRLSKSAAPALRTERQPTAEARPSAEESSNAKRATFVNVPPLPSLRISSCCCCCCCKSGVRVCSNTRLAQMLMPSRRTTLDRIEGGGVRDCHTQTGANSGPTRPAVHTKAGREVKRRATASPLCPFAVLWQPLPNRQTPIQDP